jgi:predicted transcriptional regulator
LKVDLAVRLVVDLVIDTRGPETLRWTGKKPGTTEKPIGSRFFGTILIFITSPSAVTIPTPPLGELEKAVLEDLWEHVSGDAKSVHARVGQARNISSNTIQSTLERLHRKGLLAREKISHAYVYRPLVERAELMGAMIADVVGSIGRSAPGSMLSAFVDFAARMDESNLDRLEALIAQRRAQREARGDEHGNLGQDDSS